jgi:hypothetical protein
MLFKDIRILRGLNWQIEKQAHRLWITARENDVKVQRLDLLLWETNSRVKENIAEE